jgi:hypothetical protein
MDKNENRLGSAKTISESTQECRITINDLERQALPLTAANLAPYRPADLVQEYGDTELAEICTLARQYLKELFTAALATLEEK